MKIAVYTVLVPGSYTRLHPPIFINKDVDYLVFTDRPLHSPPWKEVYLYPNEVLGTFDGTRVVAEYKCLSHQFLPDYDFVIWHDGDVILKVDPFSLVTTLCASEYGIAFGEHIYRTDVYEEAQYCAMYQTDKREVIWDQMKRYEDDEFPHNSGLVQGTFFIRDNGNKDVERLMNFWWEEIKRGSKRTELSFNYASWKTGVGYFKLNIDPWIDNEIYRIQ